jgi:hypothetical protein
MDSTKKSELLKKFFSKSLSDEERIEFTLAASQDKDFIKALIKGVELMDTVDDQLNQEEDETV